LRITKERKMRNYLVNYRAFYNGKWRKAVKVVAAYSELDAYVKADIWQQLIINIKAEQ
jgi:hypothetical protein